MTGRPPMRRRIGVQVAQRLLQFVSTGKAMPQKRGAAA